MRVLLDTNILISYLLTPTTEGSIQQVVEAGFEGRYTLLLLHEVIKELKGKLTTKKYLVANISEQPAETFMSALASIAEVVPPITEPIPAVGRDFKDDYLLAYALVGDADYLVSGDEDLSALQNLVQLQGTTCAIDSNSVAHDHVGHGRFAHITQNVL